MRELETTVLSLDQFEVLRLCDLEGLDQQTAGERLGVSRGTVQRMLYAARRNLVAAILENQAIMVTLKPGDEDNVSLYSHTGRRRPRRSGA